MRSVIIASVLLLVAAPAFAGNHGGGSRDRGFDPNPANQQHMLDAVRAAPAGAPGFSQAAKDHIIHTIEKNCPTCS